MGGIYSKILGENTITNCTVHKQELRICFSFLSFINKQSHKLNGKQEEHLILYRFI